MRIEIIRTWIFVGFGLLMLGTLLYMFKVTEDGNLARFLGVVGIVYFCIGVVLSVMHESHMAKRTRAGQE
ncbi:MAG TPA: hypothetical protein VK208_19920 [Pyrinomonadaceae bacterium]|jgi:uncharacterized membrane protein|nr:hypothetical protein [Pyrinomonadaceae bacterium]